ncbi:DsbA family oxidoreductase [Gordonia sp. TBRC 11910]|uniref:DsbA family oxidoreductase n=1 Tax=Gordonia asplenii TaxID=2725283 RepID=A0A848KVJ5_9ACTN|nr:DsbA family oxidoreductase [Gordonia asplenii]NMO02299.1 DsbA family oxidoreductase [Gordonia asplenii]
MQVEIWTDINCPFCYLGKARFSQALEQFAHRGDVEVIHRSFELDPGLSPDDTGLVVTKIAQKYGVSEAQAAKNELGIGAQAAEMGLGYVTSGRDYGSSFDMHRLLHFALEQGRQEALLDALYEANFADEAPLFGDSERLVDVAVSAGFDEAAVRAVLDDPAAYAAAVRADEAQAAAFGATGVPFFVFDRKYGVSGAQPAETFASVLEKAWSDHEPVVQMVGSDDVCGPDGCAVPGAEA